MATSDPGGPATRAFVTGITGQDGNYLAERLLADGVQVHGLVWPGDPGAGTFAGAHPDVVLHPGDLTDYAFVEDLIVQIDPHEVYNLAGISSVAMSWDKPVTTGAVTGLAVAALLEAVHGCSERRGSSVRFVQASSAEIFGNPGTSPQDEGTPIAPVNPYGAAKAYAHHLVGVYRARGMHAVSAILYNHESPRRPETFVTAKIARGAARIARGEADELVLGNLDARRDWGWAPDYVDAMVRAARHERALDYVIATGTAHSVQEFVAAAFAAVGVDDWQRYVRTDPEFVRPVDAVELVGDPARARTELGWTPTVGFQELVGRMVNSEEP